MTAAGASARAIAVVALLIATGLAADAAAGGGERAEVRVATTGNDSERCRTLPITRAPGARPAGRDVDGAGRAARPRPRRSPAVDRRAPGDQQLQLPQPALRRPRLPLRARSRARLRARAAPGRTGGAGGRCRWRRPERETCTQKRPDYEHHCVLTFTDGGLTIRDPGQAAVRARPLPRQPGRRRAQPARAGRRPVDDRRPASERHHPAGSRPDQRGPPARDTTAADFETSSTCRAAPPPAAPRPSPPGRLLAASRPARGRRAARGLGDPAHRTSRTCATRCAPASG